MQMAFGLCLVAPIENENFLGEIVEYTGIASRQTALVAAAERLFTFGSRADSHPDVHHRRRPVIVK